MKYAWSLMAWLALSVSAAEAQSRAPKGGTYVNGRFYKGGQFLPQNSWTSASPSFFATPTAPEVETYIPPTRSYRSSAVRSSARVQARTTARATAPSTGSTLDPIAIARSRIQTAKNLIKLEKFREAREWLDKVIAMNASEPTVKEARDLIKTMLAPTRR